MASVVSRQALLSACMLPMHKPPLRPGRKHAPALQSSRYSYGRHAQASCLWLQDRRGPGNRWQQIKLQRAEWTRPRSTHALFGRVLYVSNLPPVSRRTSCACLVLRLDELDIQQSHRGFVCAFRERDGCAPELLAGRVIVDVILQQICQMLLVKFVDKIHAGPVSGSDVQSALRAGRDVI